MSEEPKTKAGWEAFHEKRNEEARAERREREGPCLPLTDYGKCGNCEMNFANSTGLCTQCGYTKTKCDRCKIIYNNDHLHTMYECEEENSILQSKNIHPNDGYVPTGARSKMSSSEQKHTEDLQEKEYVKKALGIKETDLYQGMILLGTVYRGLVKKATKEPELTKIEKQVIDAMRQLTFNRDGDFKFLNDGYWRGDPDTVEQWCPTLEYRPKQPEWTVGDTPFIDDDRECEIVAIEGRQACVKYSNDTLELVNVSSLKLAANRIKDQK